MFVDVKQDGQVQIVIFQFVILFVDLINLVTIQDYVNVMLDGQALIV
jgi:hypothetical protein